MTVTLSASESPRVERREVASTAIALGEETSLRVRAVAGDYEWGKPGEAPGDLWLVVSDHSGHGSLNLSVHLSVSQARDLAVALLAAIAATRAEAQQVSV